MKEALALPEAWQHHFHEFLQEKAQRPDHKAPNPILFGQNGQGCPERICMQQQSEKSQQGAAGSANCPIIWPPGMTIFVDSPLFWYSDYSIGIND